MKHMTEDEVRQLSKHILGFNTDENAISDVGQITTFNMLGFPGINDKPDGWYIPFDKMVPAIILETKSTKINLKKKETDELIKNCNIVLKQYKNVVGLIYNGIQVKAFKNNGLSMEEIPVLTELQNKEYYLSFFNQDKIDKQKIFNLTKQINNCLHFDFGIKNLYHRMVFTACALVAKRYGAFLEKGMNYTTFHTSIHSTLSKSLEESRKQNQKLDILLEVYSEIRMNSTDNQNAIDNFIVYVSEISESVNSDYWNGEDVMGIFFNEFNRYKKKSEHGQIFTPDHITSLMYRLVKINKDDYVFDGACGSGAFLVKSMSNMIKEAGGISTEKATFIKSKQLFGIEFDREIFALACANMLIHKDGKTNLAQMDTRTEEACKWIRSKPITKVLMNPPFENRYGCMNIVENVIDSVDKGTLCAFILPDKKLENVSNIAKRLLLKHSLRKIIKLPENLFNEAIKTSIFIFESGIPQNNEEIFACYIEDDGLETVKNQGRQDVKERWNKKEDYWVSVINKQSGDSTIQWIKPSENLSYQVSEKEFEIYEEDFVKNILDFKLFENGIDVKLYNEKLLNKVLYSSNIENDNNNTIIILKKEGDVDE